MIEVYKRMKPISTTISKLSEISRIYTIGSFDMNASIEHAYSVLKFPKEKIYYFALNEEKLQSEKSLFRKITDSIKKTAGPSRPMFGIYPTKYENDYIFMEIFSPHVQDSNLEIKPETIEKKD